MDNQLRLRKATKEDMLFLFNLRNDPIVRESSFDTGKIKLETHTQWFNNKLKTKDCIILIAEYEAQRIGQIRFDINETVNTAEISISILPEFRGKGLGVNILKLACDYAFKKLLIKEIFAFIKKRNLISLKAFSKVGFSTKGYSKHKGINCLEMNLELNKLKT
ncbi:MAG: GNAT family N-acetyltransferase [Promethearchaeota archaeon]